MFQTLQPQSFRINKTSIPRQTRINLPLNISQRPATMNIQRQQFLSQTQPQSPPTHHYSLRLPHQNIFKTIDDAQLELTHSFRQEMSPYLHQKIRCSLSRNNKRRVFFSRASSYQDNPENDSFLNTNIDTIDLNKTPLEKSPLSIKAKHIKFSNIFNRELKSPLKSKELVFESIITNTKQKIDRMIGLKREKQEQYQELKKSIEKKCLKQQKYPFRKISVLNPTGSIKPPTIQTLDWDKEWKQELKKESTRYRNRLFAKHKRDMSMKIPLPEQIPQFK